MDEAKVFSKCPFVSGVGHQRYPIVLSVGSQCIFKMSHCVESQRCPIVSGDNILSKCAIVSSANGL